MAKIIAALEAGGGTPVSPSKKGADGGEYANSFGRDGAARWNVKAPWRNSLLAL